MAFQLKERDKMYFFIKFPNEKTKQKTGPYQNLIILDKKKTIRL